MPFNGSGTFNRLYSWVQDAANGIKIRADRMDNETNGIAQGLSDCITRDGESPATANLPMGGFGHTNVADASTLAMYPSLKQVMNMTYNLCAISGTAAAIVANGPIPITAYATNMEIAFQATSASVAGGTTINRDGIGAVTIKRGSADIAVGDWANGDFVLLRYDGTHFQMLTIATLPAVSGANLTNLNASALTSGTVPAARGGAGAINGIMKANGAGLCSAAVPNTDYAPPASPTFTGTITGPDGGTWDNTGLNNIKQMSVVDTQNGPVNNTCKNANSGTAAYAQAAAINNSAHGLYMRMFSSGYTQSAYNVPDCGLIVCDGTNGLNIGTTGVTPIRVFINGGFKWYFDSDGGMRSVSMGVAGNEGFNCAGNIRSNGAIGVNCTPSTTAGRIDATNDIVAFSSDIRLKTNLSPIENALDKVMALRGFTYNFNDIGETLGFDPEDRHVGVSAQDVLAVQPEAVKPAPVDHRYYTVQYEKLVPLLIEAIKEQQMQIEDLKSRVTK